MNANEILQKVLKGGWKTSEFWISAAAIALPYILPRADSAVTTGTNILAQHGTAGVLAGSIVAGAYAVGRSIVKAKTAGALLEPVDPVKATPVTR